MKLRGEYNVSKTYEVGDVVVYTDGVVYHLQKPAKSGVPPVDTRYWGRVSQSLQDAVLVVMDALEIESVNNIKLANNLTTTAAGKGLDARQGKALKDALDALELRAAALEPEPEPEPTTQGGD